MINLIHCSIDDFVRKLEHKKLACFGAGYGLDYFTEQYERFSLSEKIDVIIDNYKNGVYKENTPIISLKKFLKTYNNNYIVVITNYNYAEEIIRQLSKEKKLIGMECYFFKFFEVFNDNEFTDSKIEKLLTDYCDLKTENCNKLSIGYIADFTLISGKKLFGVMKKTENQINTLKSAGLNVKKCNIKRYPEKSFKFTLYAYLPFCSEKNYKSMLDDCKYDAYYIRYFYADRNFVRFCKKIKKKNPKAKIIIEIPTYPYDNEIIFNFNNISLILKDKINRQKLYKYVDRIITFSRHTKIWKIKTINTVNGIDVINSTKRNVEINSRQISIIAVANFAGWHGYDRFLEGLGEYYKNGSERDVILHLVGYDGEIGTESLYKKIIDKYNINKYVIMHGKKTGAELDEIYDKSNISLGSLGLHRIDKTLVASTLKTREYVAKGLPVIASGKVDIFDETYPYYLELPADETPINIESVIRFYDKIYPNSESYQKVHDEIREFAEKKCDMNVTMQPVIEYIRNI